jgi:hypothetical protein
MKKICFLGLIGLLFFGAGVSAEDYGFVTHDIGKYEKRADFLNSIEFGTASWESFVRAVKSQQIFFEDVSPKAVANYLEAFANEGMLEMIPFGYFDDNEVVTSLDIVFQDPANICKNQDVYKDQLR